MAPLSLRPVRLLEVGVHQGTSVKTLSRYFARGRVVGVDLKVPDIDLSDHPNVSLIACDQRDRSGLHQICDREAPQGFDVIIDDASHVGEWTLETYRALFPRLKPGGLYFIEDWATGYWPQWFDGSSPRMTQVDGKRVVSHDFGVVGVVKSLVDDVVHQPVAWMHVRREITVLREAD